MNYLPGGMQPNEYNNSQSSPNYKKKLSELVRKTVDTNKYVIK